ncbi:MAG: hypothetical protein WCZ89_08545, partial [Phycisphaerae bacterium]
MCLKIVCLIILLPLFYWGSVKILFVPLAKLSDYTNPTTALLIAFIVVVSFDFIWFLLMMIYYRNKTHIKVILTLFILALSAAILTCFFAVVVMDKTFS